jgi:hypothetical protein
MSEILMATAVLLLINIIGIHIYFVIKAKKRLDLEIAALPNEIGLIVERRSEAIKSVRKSGKKLSFELAAATLKLSDAICDEKEDLWNVASPQRFDASKSWYRSFQIWKLSFNSQGFGAFAIGICVAILLVTTWTIVFALLGAFMESHFEAQMGAILKERELKQAA